MRIFDRICMGAGVLLMAIIYAGMALAADLPSRKLAPLDSPVYTAPSWTGLYLGGFGGHSWATQRKADVSGSFGQNVYLNTDSALAGVRVGGDYQLGRFVAGAFAEGSLNLTDKNTTSFSTAALSQGTALAQVQSNWQKVGQVGGRVGFLLMPNLLVYGMGGPIFAEPGIQIGLLSSPYMPLYSAKFGGFKTGWGVGGGAEWRVGDHLSFDLRFLHADLGQVSSTFGAVSQAGEVLPLQANYRARFNRVTMGVNYRVDWGAWNR